MNGHIFSVSLVCVDESAPVEFDRPLCWLDFVELVEPFVEVDRDGDAS